MTARASLWRQLSVACLGCKAVVASPAALSQKSMRGIMSTAAPYSVLCTRLSTNTEVGCCLSNESELVAMQRRWRYGHKRKGSFMERISKNAAGQFLAYRAHYRHKRYNKSTKQLWRLSGKFVLPDFLQRKLRKAGF